MSDSEAFIVMRNLYVGFDAGRQREFFLEGRVRGTHSFGTNEHDAHIAKVLQIVSNIALSVITDMTFDNTVDPMASASRIDAALDVVWPRAFPTSNSKVSTIACRKKNFALM